MLANDPNHTIVGTPMYMPKELIKGECKNPEKHDVWSSGIMLY